MKKYNMKNFAEFLVSSQSLVISGVALEEFVQAILTHDFSISNTSTAHQDVLAIHYY